MADSLFAVGVTSLAAEGVSVSGRPSVIITDDHLTTIDILCGVLTTKPASSSFLDMGDVAIQTEREGEIN